MLNLLDRIGNLNPQLLRELKGRLTWRSFLTVIGVSIVAQMLLLLLFYTQLPNPDTKYSYSAYCSRLLKGALVDNCYDVDPKFFIINWRLWWQHIAQTLSLSIPFLWIVPGTFLLLSDLQNEERQGTLDFVRLSPRSAMNILLGKILGVPFFLYCTIASLIPFHAIAMLKAGHSPLFLFSYYGLMTAGAYLIFSFTLLFGFFSTSILKQSAQALGATILYGLLVAAIFVPGYITWNSATVWSRLVSYPAWDILGMNRVTSWTWFGLPISQNIAIAHLFTLANIAILCGWIWQGLTRCFHQPNATILPKRQSYGWITYLQILILGLGIQGSRTDAVTLRHLGVVILPIVLNLPIFLTLIALLTPQRQAVMDWARYRRMQSPRASLFKDLLFHDHSPAGIAIGLNLIIAGGLWLIAFALGTDWTKGQETIRIMLTLLSLTVIALYAAIVQWIVIQKTRKRSFIATSAIALLMLLPPVFVGLLSSGGLVSTSVKEGVILTSPFLWVLAQPGFSLSLSVWGALLSQLSLIAGINALIARQVRQIGASEVKKLTA